MSKRNYRPFNFSNCCRPFEEEKRTFFEAVIVLEEFCKELAATWQIWSTHQQ
jgi:hypothetical protein